MTDIWGVDQQAMERFRQSMEEWHVLHRFNVTTLILVGLLALPGAAYGGGLEFDAELTSAQSVPTPGPGLIVKSDVVADFDEGFTEVDVTLKVDGGANVVAAHFHCALPGEIGPVVFGLFGPGPLVFDGTEAEGSLTNADFTGADCVPFVGRPGNNIAALALAMREGLIYSNVHTTDNLPGEVRGQMLEE